MNESRQPPRIAMPPTVPIPTPPESTASPSNAPGESRALPPLGILAGLSDESLATLASYGHYERFPAGTVVIIEGNLQDRFYVVVSGKLAVTARACGKDVELNVAEAGECLGEVCLLEPGAASASVRVLEDAVIWSMNVDDLRGYLAAHAGGGGALLIGMASCLSKRLRDANQLISKHHVPHVEVLPEGRQRAITASNAPVQIGFFERIKKSMGGGERKVRISTKIKM